MPGDHERVAAASGAGKRSTSNRPPVALCKNIRFVATETQNIRPCGGAQHAKKEIGDESMRNSAGCRDSRTVVLRRAPRVAQ